MEDNFKHLAKKVFVKPPEDRTEWIYLEMNDDNFSSGSNKWFVFFVFPILFVAVFLDVLSIYNKKELVVYWLKSYDMAVPNSDKHISGTQLVYNSNNVDDENISAEYKKIAKQLFKFYMFALIFWIVFFIVSKEIWI